MYIGKLAELTGATPKAIRLYESLGLIPVPLRKGNYRIYTEKDVALIRMIRRAQQVGFTLNELKDLVALKAEGGGFPLGVAIDLIATKRVQLRRQADEIRLLDQRLVALQEELQRAFGEPGEN